MKPDLRVVLVRPHFPGNLGSVARVMHNFGWSRLILVDPVADPSDKEARRLSTHGEFILESARFVPNLGEAVAECAMVLATSAKTDGVVRESIAGSPRELFPRVVAQFGSQPVALVFGPEPSGLTTAEIACCHYLLQIPTGEEYPALNLAQAVAICLYELHLALAETQSVSSGEVAPHSEQARMFDDLQCALERIHFLFGPKAEALMHALRHLIGRAGPTPTEVRILHGLARQLIWVAERLPDA